MIISQEQYNKLPTHLQSYFKPMVNGHPTIKPLSLISYLVKLVKMPQYNLILDPFCGSGTTLLACIKLGIPCIGIDSDDKYCEIAAKRCSQSVMRLEI